MTTRIQKIKKLVEHNKLKEACNMLIQAGLNNQGIHLKARLRMIEDQHLSGVVNNDTYYKEIAKIQFSIISFTNSLKEDDDNSKERYVERINIDNEIEKAFNLYKTKKYKDALAKYTSIVNGHPTNTDALIGLGRVFDRLKMFEKSIEYYRKALDINPNLDIPINNIGVVYEQLGNPEVALSYYKQAFFKNTSIEIYFDNVVNLLSKKDQYDEIVTFCQQVIQTSSKTVTAYFILAKTLNNKFNNYTEALDYINQAIYLDNNNPKFFYERASIYLNLNNFPEAVSDLNICKLLSPYDATYSRFKAAILLDNGEYYDANDELDISIKIDPNDSHAHLMKGVCLYHIRDYENSIIHLKQSYYLEPNECEAYKYLSKIYDMRK
ncbi:MAG: tetratricopeptide repeat protein, partial [Bacteroidota bacterium]